MATKLRIKLVKSRIGQAKKNNAIIDALGLRKMNQVVERTDTPEVHGMIHKVKHMLEVEKVEVAEEKPKAKRTKKSEE
jgi:large subunit ribosomal protein L30